MDKINVVMDISKPDSRDVLFTRQNGRQHAYRKLSYRQWHRLLLPINYALNDDTYQAVINSDGWLIYRK